MGFHITHFSENTGLSYDKKAQCFWGTMSGYPVFVEYLSRRGSLVFRLYGKLSTDENIAPPLEQWRISQQGVSGLTYRNRCLSCVIAIASRDADLNAINHVDSLVHLANMLSLVPCCMSCGTEYGYNSYMLDDTGVCLCDACRARTLERVGEVAEEHAQVRVNPLGTVLGLLIGCVVLIALTYIVLRLGYVSYLTGYVGALIAFVLMKKLGRKLTLPIAVIGVIVTMAAAAFTPILCFAKDFADFNQEQYSDALKYVTSYESVREELESLSEQDMAELAAEGTVIDLPRMKAQYEECQFIMSHRETGDCLRDFFTMLKMDTYSDVKGEVIKCILWGVISILIGSALTLPRLLKESAGKHELRAPTV